MLDCLSANSLGLTSDSHTGAHLGEHPLYYLGFHYHIGKFDCHMRLLQIYSLEELGPQVIQRLAIEVRMGPDSSVWLPLQYG